MEENIPKREKKIKQQGRRQQIFLAREKTSRMGENLSIDSEAISQHRQNLLYGRKPPLRERNTKKCYTYFFFLNHEKKMENKWEQNAYSASILTKIKLHKLNIYFTWVFFSSPISWTNSFRQKFTLVFFERSSRTCRKKNVNIQGKL